MINFLYLLGISAISATIFAFILKNKGYPFWRNFVTVFIATSGIVGLIYKLVQPYL